MKKFQLLVSTLLLFCCIFSFMTASASDVMPIADTEFISAYPNLLSTKKVTFRCNTYQTKGSLSVTACWLEQEIDGEWEFVCDLTPPSWVAYNTFAYSETVDYSSAIGSGTYRVWGTFNADGHAISRCSNERTFN